MTKKTQHLFQIVLSPQQTSRLTLTAIAICYAIGAFIGYLMQNRYNHIYDIAILFPLILILSLAAKILSNCLTGLIPFKNHKQPTGTVIISILFITLAILPQKQIFAENYHQLRDYQIHTHLSRWTNAENPAFAKRELKIKNTTDPNSCINVQHGWNVGQQYYYAHRKPCTRFFITNILPPEKIPEYQSQLINNPPSALINFTTLTDLNIEHFEQHVFNFTKVINDCFTQDTEFPNLYWPALPDQQFKQCFQTGLPDTTTNQ